MSTDKLDEAIANVGARMDRAAEEAIRELFARFPFGQKVALFTGKNATITAWHEPKRDATGRWCFGVDIRYDDGSGHIEYRLTQTGWGGKP